MNYKIFGIVTSSIASGKSEGLVQSFYCSGPISKAYLLIGDKEFPSKSINFQRYDAPFQMYKIVFFQEDVALPLGNGGTEYQIRVETGVDGYVIFYVTTEQST